MGKVESTNKNLSMDVAKLSEEASTREKLVEDLSCKLKSSEDNIVQLTQNLQDAHNSKVNLQTEKEECIKKINQHHQEEFENLMKSHNEKIDEMNKQIAHKKRELEEMELFSKSEIHNREEETKNIRAL